MATPTASTYTRNVGRGGITQWSSGAWPGSPTDFTDEKIVDLSAQAYTNALILCRLELNATAGIGVTLEFDDDSADQHIYRSPVGVTSSVDIDYSDAPDGGLIYSGSGGTGDIILTTDSAAAADEVSLTLHWRCI